MLRSISALITTLVAIVAIGATSSPAAAPGTAPTDVVLAGNHWCC
ncbi:MAG: hypothetical protein WBQ50_13875 [Nocardioides sp.]